MALMLQRLLYSLSNRNGTHVGHPTTARSMGERGYRIQTALWLPFETSTLIKTNDALKRLLLVHLKTISQMMTETPFLAEHQTWKGLQSVDIRPGQLSS